MSSSRLSGPPNLLFNRYLELEADYSPPITAEVKKALVYASTPPFALKRIAWNGRMMNERWMKKNLAGETEENRESLNHDN